MVTGTHERDLHSWCLEDQPQELEYPSPYVPATLFCIYFVKTYQSYELLVAIQMAVRFPQSLSLTYAHHSAQWLT